MNASMNAMIGQAAVIPSSQKRLVPASQEVDFEWQFFDKYFGYDYQQVFAEKYYTGAVEEATVLRWQIALWRYIEQPQDNTWMVSGQIKKHFSAGNVGKASVSAGGYSHFPKGESEDRCMLTFVDEQTRDSFINWRKRLYARFNLPETVLPVPKLIKGGKIEGWIAEMNPDRESYSEEMAFKIWAWVCKHCDGNAWVIESSLQIVFQEETDYVLFTMANPATTFKSE